LLAEKTVMAVRLNKEADDLLCNEFLFGLNPEVELAIV
jgi:hypothetical protein